MFSNYIKIAWRNLLRNRSYSLVNIMGLAIGLSCFMFIMLFVMDELSYDKFHENGENIYRVALDRQYPERVRKYAIIPHSYAEVMQSDFEEVEEATRVFYFPGGNLIIRKDGQLYEEPEVAFADSNFFNFFTIPLLRGNARTCLTDVNTVVLTERLAKKYFGDADPIGQELELPQNDNNLMVTGVCANVPENSHLRFDMLRSSATLGFIQQQPNYINFSAYTYLKLNPNADPDALEAKLPDLVKKYISGQMLQRFGIDYEEYQRQGNGYHYYLQPLEDIYLDSNLESEMKTPGSRQRVQFFTLIALLIIGIAVINFMNLATARSAGRAREVGIRKTLGSSRQQIAVQFLTEAVIISLAAAVIAWLINFALLEPFNGIIGKSFTQANLTSPRYLGILFFTALVTGLLSGAYPAFALSAYKPVQVLRGAFLNTGKGALLRNALVVFQFGISVFLIISTILIYKQWAFTQKKELGFRKESVVNLQGAAGMTEQQEETFKNRLRDLPGITAVGGCTTSPGGQFFGISFREQGRSEVTAGSGVMVDEGYIDCMEMEIIKGRSFSEEFMDTLSIIVNEAAVKEMGLTDPIGAQIVSNDDFLNPVEGELSVYTIVGVVKDFHFQSLHHIISPLFFIHDQRSFVPGVTPTITMKLTNDDIPGTLAQVERMWAEIQPDVPFRYAFLDREWAQLYEKEMTTRRVSGLFSLIAIFIACLGLLALAAFTAERRTKEIGIRKVLGASVPGIVGMLSKDFLKLVAIGIILASPVAWWVMDRWLQGFAYRIDISWTVFVLAAVIALVIAFLTVSFQSVRAALSNPVKAIRTE